VNRNITKLRIITLTVFLLHLQNSEGQIHSSSSAHTTYTGLSMAGYQGWFGTPNDGGTNSFRHYAGSNGFKPGSAKIEYWPDMREADADEICTTGFTFKDGLPATVFSSVNPKTVNRHFQWMKEYGIDGAFVQRFKSDFGIRNTLDKVMLNALEGAEKNNRALAVMYDIGANIYENGTDTASVDSTRTVHVNEVFNDWKHLVDELGLTTRGDRQAYLYHHGKPLVALWGVGFPHRHNSTGLDMQFWIELVDKFQNDPEYGGCSVLLGVPTYWLQGGNDCISGSEHTKMLDLIRNVDAIMPWHTSRFSRTDMATLYKSLVKSDISWCNEANVDYAPCISPGIREKILQGNGYEKYREGGYYFWDMAKAAIEAGSKLLYLGMFDEIDEGTQLHKINNNPPFYSNAVPFASYGSDPEDHYLWLSGEISRALRGEFTMETQYRARANDTGFQSEIAFIDHDSIYDMYLIHAGSGRKVFYADPYKVGDGAPTTGTKRDTSLFANELTGEKVTFTADQRGLCVRFVEVDEATDEIITFKAIVGVHGYATVPYSTSFEDNLTDPKFWSFHTENSSGRINVTNNFGPKTGAFHLSFDANGDGTGSINSADLYVNLKGIARDIVLNFSYKTFSSEVNPEDGIYFSNDGGVSFSRVFGFGETNSVYIDTALNINELIESAGLSFTENFVIRFQHTDIKPIDEGGLVLDDVKILFPPATETNDILEGFNGSFEDNLSFWRFYEVPNSLGSLAEIITGDVVHGAKAARITYVAPDINLADRSLDNWDSNMPLKPGTGYICKFWAKTDSPDVGKVDVTYGFFDVSRNVISEAGAWFSITNTYEEYEFSFTAPAGTAKGWLAFRWKDQVNDTFLPGVVYFDHIQLLTEDKPVGIKNIVQGNANQSALVQNYPNPFGTSTTISYILPENSGVQLSIYTVYGQKVADLVNQKMNAGAHEVVWNAANFVDGIYLIMLKTGSGLVTKKMILSK
jgi:glycoprotein endo-alpha-1,2-mannosidase